LVLAADWACVSPKHTGRLGLFGAGENAVQLKDPTKRFSGRVGAYVKYRQGYPDTLVPLIEEKAELTSGSAIADVGCGTGLLAESFLKNGYAVQGVEPNQEMRESAELRLRGFSRFRSVAGSAEATGLQPRSIDLVTVGRAFHWFDTTRALAEFSRILKPYGWCVIVWNRRKASPFVNAYNSLLQTYCDDYRPMRSARDQQRKLLEAFGFRLAILAHGETCTLEQLQGRILSLSVTPDPENPKFEPMLQRIEGLFHEHEVQGHVRFEYDTLVYHRCLSDLDFALSRALLKEA
jgi:ubiquinone/menaquinone biosynthesis C-methylase UbiE